MTDVTGWLFLSGGFAGAYLMTSLGIKLILALLPGQVQLQQKSQEKAL